jgi:uncharacterized repeat protein (TIGR03803 family)
MSKFNWGIRACGVLLLWAAGAVALPAQTFTTLHSFAGTDGATPEAGLVQGIDGNFYGTTTFGGAGADGTVFMITLGGRLTTLHSFDGTDGDRPAAGLVLGTSGDFYGTTNGGGTSDYGTIFSFTTSGTLKTLHSFDNTDGAYPVAALVQGNDKELLGTTALGGPTRGCCGTIFKIAPRGYLTTLYVFGHRGHGNEPLAGLIRATDGRFYGTTYGGGANGAGTVIKFTAGGTPMTLHTFDRIDGALPYAGLVQATDGNLYGTTEYGGANNLGTVFKITPKGTLTTLYNFCSQTNCADGTYPQAALVQGSDGNFYGTTEGGGANGEGTLFSIAAGGKLTTIHSFCTQTNCTDGANPVAALVQATDGNFYGTAYDGGAERSCMVGYGYGSGCGTIFSLSVGLGPFVETQPTSGTVGTAVNILGTDLTDATSVTFSGTAATFTVKSKSEITTTVPTGATTGTVQVVTPGRTLSSNVPFRVK